MNITKIYKYKLMKRVKNQIKANVDNRMTEQQSR